MGKTIDRGVARSASIGIVNQIIASAANFGIAVYLVRTLDPAGFGLWGIGFSVVLLTLGLANGLVLTQMVVGLPNRPVWARPSYLRSMLIGTVASGLVVVLLGTVIAVMLHTSGPLATFSRSASASADITDSISHLVLATSFAAASVILLHYFLRQAFSVNRETIAVVLNCILLVSGTILIWLVHHYQGGMTATAAMWLYGLAHLLSAAIGAIALPVYRRHFRVAILRRDLKDAWNHGRWAMAGVWVSWGQSQAYVFLTPLFFGLTGLGTVNAARMIAAPLLMLLPAVNQVALPRFSQMQVNQPHQTVRTGVQISILLLSFAGIYALFAAGTFDFLSQLLLGDARRDLFWITMAWCLMAGLSLVRQIATVMMQSARLFYSLFRFESAVLIVTIGGMCLLFGPLGLPSAVVATAIGESLIAILVWRYFITNHRTPRPTKITNQTSAPAN